MYDSSKIRAVLDTTVLFSMVIKKEEGGLGLAIFEKMKNGSFVLCMNSDLRQEYDDKLNQAYREGKCTNPKRISDVLNLVARYGNFVRRPAERSNICRDPDDRHVFDVAIVTKVDFIVSNDKHILVLKKRSELGATEIVSPEEFMGILRATEGM